MKNLESTVFENREPPAKQSLNNLLKKVEIGIDGGLLSLRLSELALTSRLAQPRNKLESLEEIEIIQSELEEIISCLELLKIKLSKMEAS